MMKKLMLCLMFMLIISLSYALPVTSGLITHLDGTSVTTGADGEVLSWNDLSGNGTDMLPVDAGATMVSTTINGTSHNVVLFGGDGYLELGTNGNYSWLSAVTVFIVGKASNAVPVNNQEALFSIAASTHPALYTVQSAGTRLSVRSRNATGGQVWSLAGDYGVYEGDWFISETTRQADYDLVSWLDGDYVTTTSGAVLPFNNNRRVRLGAPGWDPPAANQLAHCELAEVIVFNRELAEAEHGVIGSYLDEKYNIATSYIPEPTTICLLGIGALGLLRRKYM